MTRYQVLTATLLFIHAVYGQDRQLPSEGKPDTRTISFHAGIGFPALASLGAQYQIEDRIAVGATMSVAVVGAQIDGGFGGGISGSYFFHRTGEGMFLSMNVLRVEASYLATSNRAGGGATLLEATVGHDAVTRHGLGFFWQIGIAHGQPNGIRPLISPAAKIGLKVDL